MVMPTAIILAGLVSMSLFICLQFTNIGQSTLVVVIFEIAVWLTIVWECTSYWVLYDAFKRLTKISQDAGLNINTKMVRLHLVYYTAYLLSLLLLFSALLDAPEVAVIVSTNLFAVATFTGQLGLVFIFN